MPHDISNVFSPLTSSFLLIKAFYQCLVCTVVVRCKDCGLDKASRTEKRNMTSQMKRDKYKCYHEDRSTFNLCTEIKYFDVNWRKTWDKDNLQPNCYECNKSLLWMAKPKKKESSGAS